MKSNGLGALVAGGARWWAVFTVAFFATFPVWSGALLWTLRTILEGLNNFGSGY